MNEEIKIRGTLASYNKFLRSIIWQDMQAELLIWKSMAESEYRIAESMEDVARIQGRVEAVEELLTLPNRLAAALEVASDKNYSKEQYNGK